MHDHFTDIDPAHFRSLLDPGNLFMDGGRCADILCQIIRRAAGKKPEFYHGKIRDAVDGFVHGAISADHDQIYFLLAGRQFMDNLPDPMVKR